MIESVGILFIYITLSLNSFILVVLVVMYVVHLSFQYYYSQTTFSTEIINYDIDKNLIEIT